MAMMMVWLSCYVHEAAFKPLALRVGFYLKVARTLGCWYLAVGYFHDKWQTKLYVTQTILKS